MAVSHRLQPQSTPLHPPPLGDLSTRRIVRLVLMAQAGSHLPTALRVRGASLDDVRRELMRRQVTGAGVRP